MGGWASHVLVGPCLEDHPSKWLVNLLFYAMERPFGRGTTYLYINSMVINHGKPFVLGAHPPEVRLLRFFKPLYLLVAGIMVSLKTGQQSQQPFFRQLCGLCVFFFWVTRYTAYNKMGP